MEKFMRQRQFYPALAHRTYLNTAASGLIPTYAADAMCAHIRSRMLEGLDTVSNQVLWDETERLREKIARMLHCAPGEIAIGPNAAALFNIFAGGIPLAPGDNVITCDTVYYNMTYSWMNKEKDGVEMRLARAVDGRIDLEAITGLVDERTRAITVCHVDFRTGFRHDIAALGRFCRERGIHLAVDATQSCGVMEIDVEAMQVDFLISSGYKWLQCVNGIGIAYISKALLKVLGQPDMGWVGVKDMTAMDPLVLDLSEDAKRYEYGSPDFTAISGLHKTIDAYLKLGPGDIQAYVLSLTDYVYQRAAALRQVRLLGDLPEQHRSSIVTVLYPEDWPVNRDYLLDRCITVMPLGPGRCRLGIHYYNNREDIDRFFDVLAELDGK